MIDTQIAQAAIRSAQMRRLMTIPGCRRDDGCDGDRGDR